MLIYTLNVSQGQFVVVVGPTQAFIVDSFVPLSAGHDTVHVKQALSQILQGKHLVGLIVTGFDADHFCVPGMKLVLNKYRPDWVMYPRYYKDTGTANRCFSAIEEFKMGKPIPRYSVALKDNTLRFFNTLSHDFRFELFSPHVADMNCSNNGSIVCKVTEVVSGATYLITGDTEDDRWDTICEEFEDRLKADVLAVPHHGSDNGLTQQAAALIRPHTALISAGVRNQYGHPDASTISLLRRYGAKVYSTKTNTGQSLKTHLGPSEVQTTKFVLRP